MKELYYSDNIIVILIALVVICGGGYYLGSIAINKIPVANLKARLLKTLEYVFFMLFIFFILLIKFQGLFFLGVPNEFITASTKEMQVYQSIQSLQIAHSSFYYVFFAWIMTSYFLIRKVLKEENGG